MGTSNAICLGLTAQWYSITDIVYCQALLSTVIYTIIFIFIKNLFINKESEEQKNDFSDFFLNAKSKEKAKVIRQVLREANEEQRELVRKYNRNAKPQLS